MNISTLESYVERQNSWTALFGQKPLSLLNAQDRQRIAQRLDSDLSPENLTCDGELRGSDLRDKQRYLLRCAEELVSIDPTVSDYFMEF
jgi:hypothetical protein